MCGTRRGGESSKVFLLSRITLTEPRNSSKSLNIRLGGRLGVSRNRLVVLGNCDLCTLDGDVVRTELT